MGLDASVPAVSRLKAVLEGHGYTGPAALEVLGTRLGEGHARVDLPVYLRRLATPAPLHVLIRLFGLFVPVTEDEARGAFAPLDLDALVAAGVLLRRDGAVRALVGITAYEGLVLAHDRNASEDDLERDHVLGVNRTTLALAQLTVRHRARTALDLGCGNGVQALLAARHVAEVTGVDVNPRALEFARFNARLNGITNVEWLLGDLFAPVAGRRFDLVVSNPPYVVSPDSTFTFRDGGRGGDALCAEVVRRSAEHLADGGLATVLCNWALGDGEDPAGPPRRWVEGTGCDALVLQRGVQDPLSYAALWNRTPDAAAYAAALDRWLDYFAAQGIARVGLGAVVLRRRSTGPSWVRICELPQAPRGSAHAHLLRLFEAGDLLAAAAGEAPLLRSRLRASDDHRVLQTLAPRRGEYALEDAAVRLEGGFGFEGTIDAHAYALLRACDGRRPMAAVLEELSRDRGVERASALDVARRLLSLGFLVPAEAPADAERRTS